MEFNEFSTFTKVGLEGAGCILLATIAYKIYKMKIHSRSGCCGDKFVVETLNRGGSSSNLEFSNMARPHTPPIDDGVKKDNVESAVI